MADIELRFHRDMLVLSAPIDYRLAERGVDVDADMEFMSLFEDDTVSDLLSMEQIAGAACLVTNTEGICRARLAHRRMEDAAADIASSALAAATGLAPQHVICAIGPCGLPLDPSDEASLERTRAQYEGALKAFGDAPFDAVLLDGMRTIHDMACAIEGARRATDRPVLASVTLGADGTFDEAPLENAASCMAAADVVGIRSSLGIDALTDAVATLARVCAQPLLVQIDVAQPTEAERRMRKLGRTIEGNPYPDPDSLADAAVALRAAGAQFLRAVGEATPAYTGALAVVCAGAQSVR